MKKISWLLLTGLLGQPPTGVAQKSFGAGTNLINAGIGLGTIFWGNGFSSGISPLGVYERGVSDQVGIGGMVGFFHSSMSSSGANYYNSRNANGILIGGRLSYHFLTTGKIDPYASLDLGYINASTNSIHNAMDTAVGSVSIYESYLTVVDKFTYGIHGGIRYYFKQSMGIYAELGIGGFYLVNAGISFRF
jgi:hypothetical protein